MKQGNEVTARPLCVRCVSFSEVVNPGKARSGDQCAHVALVDPVRGGNADCAQARRLHGGCGPEGRLFVGNPVERP